MTRGLVLSGGGARGSFQMGAIDCLYTVFGYRPEVIAATSVGSINALALAQAASDDEALAQMRRLRDVWASLTGPGDFYAVQEWFARLTRRQSLDLGEGVGVPFRIEDAIIQLIFENLWDKVEKATSLAVMDPLEARIRTPEMFDPVRLANGIPLRMMCVSMESGRLRYVTGDGRFLEDDNRTPVASALVTGEAPQQEQSDFNTALAAVQSLTEQIERERKIGPGVPWGVLDSDDALRRRRVVARLRQELERARWRAETAFDRLAAANARRAVPVEARVDPVIGALASSAMPGIFQARRIGAETYVDGGVREIVPVRAAVQMGATEVLAIVCSTQNLPQVGDASTMNFADTLITSLTNITLKQVIEDDLLPRDAPGVPVKVIIPAFDVHDTAVVDMGLIHIAMDYGFMRAADAMSSVPGDVRREAFVLSDAIIRLRTETHRMSLLWNRPFDSDSHDVLEVLRLRKWLIRKLTEARIASGVALPGFSTLWFQLWEQGSSSFPNEPTPWNSFTTFVGTTPAIAPYAYVPDGWTYEEVGDLEGRYLIRAGACFRASPDAIAVVTRPGVRPALTIPVGATRHLPAVPIAGTVLVEVTTPDLTATPGVWYIDGVRRYELNAAAQTALGNPTPARIPAGGLAQIPDGGGPSFLGGLVVTDTAGTPLDLWQPTPQVEGTVTSTGVTVRNRSGRGPVTVRDMRITTPQDGGPAGSVFRIRTALPFVVANGATFDVDVEFRAPAPGPLAGMVEIDCDDAIAAAVRVPAATSVLPLGDHAELTVAPGTLEIAATRVGGDRSGRVALTNVGGRDATIESLTIEAAQPPGQFMVSDFGVNWVLAPGEQTSVGVVFSPAGRGTAQCRLVVAMSSDTDQPGIQYRRRHEVPVSASARAPMIFIASAPSPVPIRVPAPVVPDPILVRPGIPPVPRPRASELRASELTVLDFGLAAVGESVTRSCWVRNVGDEPLVVGIPQPLNMSVLSVANWASFPATLLPGGEVELSVSLSAGFVPGERSETELWIFSDDPLRPRVDLRATIQATGPHFREPPELIDLGLVTTGTGTVISFVSDGSDPVSVSEIRLQDGRDFLISGAPSLPTQVAPGGVLNMAVALIATAPGPYQDRLIVHHDGNRGRESSILIRGTVS